MSGPYVALFDRVILIRNTAVTALLETPPTILYGYTIVITAVLLLLIFVIRRINIARYERTLPFYTKFYTTTNGGKATNIIKQVSDNCFVCASKTHSMVGLRSGVTGKLLLYSPIPLPEDQIRFIEELSNCKNFRKSVSVILSVPGDATALYKERYPNARVFTTSDAFIKHNIDDDEFNIVTVIPPVPDTSRSLGARWKLSKCFLYIDDYNAKEDSYSDDVICILPTGVAKAADFRDLCPIDQRKNYSQRLISLSNGEVGPIREKDDYFGTEATTIVLAKSSKNQGACWYPFRWFCATLKSFFASHKRAKPIGGILVGREVCAAFLASAAETVVPGCTLNARSAQAVAEQGEDSDSESS